MRWRPIPDRGAAVYWPEGRLNDDLWNAEQQGNHDCPIMIPIFGHFPQFPRVVPANKRVRHADGTENNNRACHHLQLGFLRKNALSFEAVLPASQILRQSNAKI